MYLINGGRGRFDTYTEGKVMQKQSREKFENFALRDWNNVAINPGISFSNLNSRNRRFSPRDSGRCMASGTLTGAQGY